jgi:predicted O-methyltransferase YrrM
MSEPAIQEAEAQALSSRVVALYARFQEFQDSSDPQAVITDTAVRSWLQEADTLGKLLTPGSVARLGPHTSSLDNLRLAARNATQRLLQIAWLSEETRKELQEYLDRNPAYRQIGPYRFSSDWMSKCESDWRTMLAPLMGKPDLGVLEIGSFEGRSALWLLENVLTHPTSRIVCVDLFDGAYGEVFDENIAASGAADRVEKLAGSSGRVLRSLPPEPAFDFIYIDGSHQPLDVLEDAVLSWRLLRPGGLMTFDDYEMAAHRLANFAKIARPDIGIDAFLSAAAGQFDVVLKGFQVTVCKKDA